MSPTPGSSKPDVAPHSDKSSPDFCGVTVEVYPPSASDPTDFNTNANSNTNSNFSSSSNFISAVNLPRPSPLRTLNSVEAVPTIGTLPLGSLRIADDSDTDTPLTTPDRSRPSTASSSGRMTPTGGDVLLLDDLPAGSTVGCDAASFGTNKQQSPFPGFRDIPAGAHLFWVSPSESASTRSAYWIVTPRREAWRPADVYVKQWDQYSEVLGEPASRAEERFQKERLRQIFDVLLPYGQIQPTTASRSPALLAPPGQAAGDDDDNNDSLPSFLADVPSIWSQLTSAIHPGLLDRITGKPAQTQTTPTTGGWQVTTSDRVAGEPMLEKEAHLYATTCGGTPPPLRFTFAMDELLISASATGEQRTQQALDPTDYVIEALERGGPDTNPNPYAHPCDLAGELSFAFLTGAHLGNHALLEQWWFYATRVVFRSYALAVRRPRLALALVQTFHAQLLYDGLYLDDPSVLDAFPEHARALQRALVTYKARLDEHLLSLADRISPAQHAVGAAFADLEAFLWRRGWDLRGDYVRSGNLMLEDGEVVQAELSDFEDEDERGEFAPALVELDDKGRETGLLSWGD
ncbi:hypothetical protein F4820DRAFT_147650 [Hypoxylon rubiginosum]|uniref:Uncharacterized protein n=1 Tax=Hypoxylon rubiginosum TaxID=110542 RepID=A0ACB9ZGD4_9PEZI|nr:hypothetical protein F4820DRAFT_147650 [Hypoxylon rubiginosum]